jgi:hypothetical protein
MRILKQLGDVIRASRFGVKAYNRVLHRLGRQTGRVSRPSLRVEGREGQRNFVLISIDSLRFDTYSNSAPPNLDAIGKGIQAYAPANFTLASHMAMFMGFTPGDPHSREPFANPKHCRMWKLAVNTRDIEGHSEHLEVLEGENIVDGFNRRGYDTLGTGSVRWFNPKLPATRPLIDHFQKYYYPGRLHFLEDQVAWVDRQLDEKTERPLFLFMNIGETHVPYWHKGAAWDRGYNPCKPEAPGQNNGDECARRQRACLEYVDAQLGSLLQKLDALGFTFLICSDHGDCWGEEGLWEHGINHPAVLEVPLIIKVPDPDE